MASPTPNKGYTYPAHGGSVNAWDTPLNADFDQIDLNVAGYYTITASSTTAAVTFNTSNATVPSTATSITPNSSIAQNLTYKFTGPITSTMSILFPAAGGLYVIDNQSSGPGTLKVNTTSGTSGVILASGGSNLVYTSTVASNSANVVGLLPSKLYSFSGNPTQNVAGNAGNATGALTDMLWDYTNWQAYPCTTTGTSATAVFTPVLNRIVPEGYLTLNNDSQNPITVSDQTAKTAVYYTPLYGNWTLLSNGTTTYPYQFSQMTLTLTAGVHAANSIYDVFIFANPTLGVPSPVIGTGPAWTTATAGSGSRGTGAGTTQLSKLNGIWTNTAQVTLTNSGVTYTCPAGQGVYLGSISTDTSAGQVSCYTSFGQSRKWGVWNAFNRQDVTMVVGDNTASWTYASTTIRNSNNTAANNASSFVGLPEEAIKIDFRQHLGKPAVTGATVTAKMGIGINATSPYLGIVGNFFFDESSAMAIESTIGAQHRITPAIGIQTINCLESATAAATITYYGTETNMRMQVEYRG